VLLDEILNGDADRGACGVEIGGEAPGGREAKEDDREAPSATAGRGLWSCSRSRGRGALRLLLSSVYGEMTSQ